MNDEGHEIFHYRQRDPLAGKQDYIDLTANIPEPQDISPRP